jgi:hypothetical protein
MKEYEVQGNYGYGWDMVTTEESKAEALQQLKVYRLNERTASFRIVTVKGGER